MVLSAETCGTEVLIIFSPSELLSLRVTDSSPTHTRSMSDDESEVSFVLQWRGRVIVLRCHSSPRTSATRMCVDKCVLCAVLHRGSDLGAVRSGQGRHHVTGAVKTQRGGVPCVCRRILVVGVEAQPLPAITHVVQREPRTERVRRTGGAAVVTRTQLVQRDGRDGGAVHGQSVARLTGEVREGVWSQPGDHILLRVIFLTAVILRKGGVKLTNNKK